MRSNGSAAPLTPCELLIEQRLPGRKRFGELLLEEGLLTPEQLAHVLAEQRKRAIIRVGRIAVGLGYLTEVDQKRTLAKQLGLVFVDLTDCTIEPDVTHILPASLANRHAAVPLRLEGEDLVVALADPTNIMAIDDIRMITGRDVKVVVATRSDIEAARRELDQFDQSTESLLLEAAPLERVEDRLLAMTAVGEAPIVRAVNRIILQAVQQRASDIHVEPGEEGVQVRNRIDGVLHEVMTISKPLQAAIISRLKVMAELNIAEKRTPQDGRITVTVDDSPVDLRVVALPSVWGENIVIRILDRSSRPLELEELGFLGDSRSRYECSFTKPYGAILVTGPTGSGKSTTLYSTLHILNTPDRKIITVEDPVEYRMGGLTQMQVNPRLTFAAGLRSILRADPDVVMIGEIRDGETAGIAVQAALTGHLVLSTLHTNDAASATTRLLDMGVEPFLVSSALECVLAQRLARRLCERCRRPDPTGVERLAEIGFSPNGNGPSQPYRPVGCNYCARTGYRGRLCLVEVMPVNEEIGRLVLERRSSDEIRQVAVEQEMRTLRQDGLCKAALGLTSLDEILRVIA